MFKYIPKNGYHKVYYMTPRQSPSGAWLTAKTEYCEASSPDRARHIAEALNAMVDTRRQMMVEEKSAWLMKSAER